MPAEKRRVSGYDKPARMRPVSMFKSGPTRTAVEIRGIEVVQCVQDFANSVDLIAGKATIARLYVDPVSVDRAGEITGEIAWSRGGAETYLPSMNTVRIDPGKPIEIGRQRTDVNASLNFRLPCQAVAAGPLRLRLSRLFQPGGGNLPIGAPKPVDVSFRTGPPLRIRVIGLRYNNGEAAISPAAIHFAFLKSFLLRAYPIASIEWSQIVVDADFRAPLNESTADLANAQLAALRSREVSSGIDPRTHYFGLVDDDGSRNFMRGKAFTIPGTPQPDVVASGPAGVPKGLAGDRDASYADWYGAHELGHTFGRYHPGFPPGQQDASDANFPYENGCISPPDGMFAGLDVGDSALNLAMVALGGTEHHDVMTYADDQWLSPYTYKAILDRLIAEDAL
ncbi:hypothetical protein [Caballeronia sp. ATUFL_F1_KS39]|uniref:hypothetical protein n=1 Tax=Caballeronia sp. ATUFL_F1_KS39 TaxID=2921766 RepID=UPI002027CB76|nr:hypothetical protein [Caballeronia sp. ATUFL_F1_KS39]